MNCPACGAWTSVVQTKTAADNVERRRRCGNNHTFITEEQIVKPVKLPVKAAVLVPVDVEKKL